MVSFDEACFRRALEFHGGDSTRTVEVLEEIDSTSTRLRRRALEGCDGGTVVVADRQLAGRGRLGRSWLSGTVGNLYLSVAVALGEPLEAAVTRLPLVAGLAVRQSLVLLAPQLDPHATLKWPNDLMLSGRKAGGLLCELVPQRSLAIVGLGLNLRPTRFTADLSDVATSVSDHLDNPVLAEEVAGAFVARLEAQLLTFSKLPVSRLVAHWTAVAEPFGRRVRMGALVGHTVALDSDGRLLLRSDDGVVTAMVGGVVEDDPF